jgi:hypothetical protein
MVSVLVLKPLKTSGLCSVLTQKCDTKWIRVRIYLKNRGCKIVDSIHLFTDNVQWQTLVDTVLNPGVP